VAGPLILLSQSQVSTSEETWIPLVVTGAALLLLGIPAMLPWLLERIAARLRGGGPAAQLAIRRLQLDSGTPARVVAGVSVVLAGAIALQAVLQGQVAKYEPYLERLAVSAKVQPLIMEIDGAVAEPVAAAVRATPGVRDMVMTPRLSVRTAESGPDSRTEFGITVVSCDVLLRYTNAGSCTDGDAFQLGQYDQLTAGSTVTLLSYGNEPDRVVERTWTLPESFRELEAPNEYLYYIGSGLVVTPGALRAVSIPAQHYTAMLPIDFNQPDVLEQVRNAVAPYNWRVAIYTTFSLANENSELELFNTIRNALLGGALFTLLLAGVSMLVLALEQVRERRRALAALAATGVPTGTLARSLLWQNTVPVLLAVLLAVITGIGLAELVFRLLDDPFRMDWLSVAIFAGVATVLVLAVTALTLPTLRSSTRLTALRME
jgi:hypothetical protein